MTRPALATVAAGAVLTGVTAAGATRLAYRALTRYPPGGEKAWSRVNHRGEPVTLLEGPAAAAGAVVTALAASALLPRVLPAERALAPRALLALAAAGGGAVAFGALDDLKGSAKRRGLRGHLGALAHGEVTTGAVKLAGICATGAAGALLLRQPGGTALDARGGLPWWRACPVSSLLIGHAPHGPGGRPPGIGGMGLAIKADLAINAAVIAGAANLVNLFDLRPGRAIKVAVASAALIGAGAAASGRGAPGAVAVAAPAGAALAVLREDLGERAMLGDAGANALGAMLGAAAAASLGRPARAGVLAGIIALTAASEKVSFTRVIARTPALNWLDMLGRRRPSLPGGSAPKGGLRPPLETLLAYSPGLYRGLRPGPGTPGRHPRLQLRGVLQLRGIFTAITVKIPRNQKFRRTTAAPCPGQPAPPATAAPAASLAAAPGSGLARFAPASLRRVKSLAEVPAQLTLRFSRISFRE